jgi:DNA invertase Pin-like site-specific DNA recombinase
MGKQGQKRDIAGWNEFAEKSYEFGGRKQTAAARKPGIKTHKRNIKQSDGFFRAEPEEVAAKERFKFIDLFRKEYTVSEMCRVLCVTRQGYEKHKQSQTKPYKHADLLAEIQAIIEEDEYNDKYGRERLRDALILRGYSVSLTTVYRVCRKHGICLKVNTPKGLTKSEKDAYKNDDLLKGNFDADAPNEKLISDIG